MSQVHPSPNSPRGTGTALSPGRIREVWLRLQESQQCHRILEHQSQKALGDQVLSSLSL